jgi:hypothetical protein
VSDHRDDGERAVTPGMRRMLVAAGILVLGAGFQLYVFTGDTERFFAWTINPPLTAAFLGAGYWASCLLQFLASRERSWAGARVAVPAVLIFTTLTLVVTLVHLDRFHFQSGHASARIATWAWLAIYVGVPPVLLALLVRQLRTPGRDPARGKPLPRWLRSLLSLQAAALLGIGFSLLTTPEDAMAIWPWPLTPLTGRAIGAWLLGIGIAAAHVLYEDDWLRVRIAMRSFAALGMLHLVAVARYCGTFDWGDGRAWLYLLFLVTILGVGVYGSWVSRAA